MNELIKIEQHNGIQTVNARDLWEGLESRQQFGDWIKTRLDGFVEGTEYLFHKVMNNPGRPIVEYYLTIDTAKHIAMLERNDKGREIRQYFIEVENKARALPTGQELMALALIEASKFLEAKDKQIAELKPKAAFFDQVADSKDAIAMREAAAVLNIPGMGRTNLFKTLREKGVLDSNNVPYRRFQDAGYFRVIETSYTDAYGESHVNTKTLVYQRGLDYIRKVVAS
jgi:anti-repressor protein